MDINLNLTAPEVEIILSSLNEVGALNVFDNKYDDLYDKIEVQFRSQLD